MVGQTLGSIAAAGLVFAPSVALAGTPAGATAASAIAEVTPSSILARKVALHDAEKKVATGLLVAVMVAAGAATYGHVKAIDVKAGGGDKRTRRD